MPRSLFTPEQANRTLPLVRRIVDDVLRCGRELRDIAEAGGAGGPDRVGVLRARLDEHLEELARIGCSYKGWGFELGLVDFPAEIDGRPVLLCWRSDEQRVTWYHTAEAGFAGRRPIPAELLEDALDQRGAGADGKRSGA